MILHGTEDTSQSNWFPWLKKELEGKGYKVWVPDLPQAEKPNLKRYTDFLLANKDWEWNSETVIFGHSSGAVEILGLLQELPEYVQIDQAILVAGFRNDLGWESLKEFFQIPFDFEKIKRRAKKFILLQSDNDPFVPIDHAKYLADKLNGKLIVQQKQGHFSVSTKPKFTEFPFLLKLLD